MPTWHDRTPIYQQLADHLAAGLLDGDWADGDALPSVRALASEHLINPLTVQRALQQLAEAGLVEPRRGLGMYVRPGARERLRRVERQRFLVHEWPRLRERLKRLDIQPEHLEWENRT